MKFIFPIHEVKSFLVNSSTGNIEIELIKNSGEVPRKQKKVRGQRRRGESASDFILRRQKNYEQRNVPSKPYKGKDEEVLELLKQRGMV